MPASAISARALCCWSQQMHMARRCNLVSWDEERLFGEVLHAFKPKDWCTSYFLSNYLYGVLCHSEHLVTLNSIYSPLYKYFKVPNKTKSTSLQDFIQINIGLELSLQSRFLAWACKVNFQRLLENTPSMLFIPTEWAISCCVFV